MGVSRIGFGLLLLGMYIVVPCGIQALEDLGNVSVGLALVQVGVVIVLEKDKFDIRFGDSECRKPHFVGRQFFGSIWREILCRVSGFLKGCDIVLADDFEGRLEIHIRRDICQCYDVLKASVRGF